MCTPCTMHMSRDVLVCSDRLFAVSLFIAIFDRISTVLLSAECVKPQGQLPKCVTELCRRVSSAGFTCVVTVLECVSRLRALQRIRMSIPGPAKDQHVQQNPCGLWTALEGAAYHSHLTEGSLTRILLSP